MMPGGNHLSDQLPSHQATFYSDTKAPLFILLQPLDLICKLQPFCFYMLPSFIDTLGKCVGCQLCFVNGGLM